MNDHLPRIEAFLAELRSFIDQSIVSEVTQQKTLADTAAKLTSGDLTELIVGARKLRSQHFAPNLFGEPAWDILLGLHLAHHRGHAISVSAAVTFGDTPQSTGLRWLAALERVGFVERRDDRDDNRRSFVGLTPSAIKQMNDYTEAYAKWVGTKATMRKL